MSPIQTLTALALLAVPSLPAGAVTAAAPCRVMAQDEQRAAAATVSSLRRSAGLAAVRTDPTLMAEAARQACVMASQGVMTHSGAGRGPGAALRRQGYAWAVVAENVAAGPWDMGQVMGAWFASPHHLSNMMIPQTREMGIASALGADGRTRYWAAVFAARR